MTSSTPFKEFEPILARLKAKGLVVTRTEYSREFFGDALLEFVLGNVKGRFVRDRGEEFLEVTPLAFPNEWFDLKRILSAVVGDLGAVRTDMNDGELLEHFIAKLDAAFDKSNNVTLARTLNRLNKQATAEVLLRLGAKRSSTE